MSLNKEIIFGLSSLGDDDMYAYLEIEKKTISGNNNEYVLPEPSTSFGIRVQHALWVNGNITIYTPDGEQLYYQAFEKDTGQSDFSYGIAGLIPEGTKIVLKITSSSGTVTPTVSYNKLKFYKISPEFLGGLELAHIILSHPKANKRRRTYVIK